MKRSLRQLLMLGACLGAILAGCGGGGGGDSPPAGGGAPQAAVLAGTAAAGAPIVGTLSVKDSLGAVRSAVVAPGGRFSVAVSGMTPPFMLRAEGTVGSRTYVIHSAAVAADINGTVNVTPLTDLVVANAAAEVASAVYGRGAFAALTPEALAQATANLRARLAPVLAEVGLDAATDLVRAAFNADHTGQDALLDVLRVTVDPATARATILNIVNNQQIVDDLTAQNDLAVLGGAGVAAGLTDVQQIVALFDSFAALFATALPAPDRPALVALFDAGFLDSGNDLTNFLNDITQSPQNVGIRIDSVAFRSLSSTVADVDFVVALSGGRTFPVSWVARKSGGVWRLAGDQRIAFAGVAASAWHRLPGTPNAGITTGLLVQVEPGARSPSIHYAVVTGPGLPTAGAGRDGASGGVLLVQYGAGGTLGLASGHYLGPSTPRMTFGAMTLFGAGLPLTDGSIGLIADNATYTFTLYGDPNNTPGNLADDVVRATYTSTLPRRPGLFSQLSAASFPVVGLTLAQVAGFATAGGSLDVAWSLPAGLKAEDVSASRQGTGGGESTSQELAAAATRATLTWGAPSFTASLYQLEVQARDGFDRRFYVLLGNY